jgi:formylglycine-generating enzyme required for sulfatase activity
MVSLAGGTITGSGSSGAFISGRTVTLSAFKIARYETTYALWKEVYDWAVAHSYTFANPGVEGHGTDGTGTAVEAVRKLRPVTTINWRDAIVWCNAYSEMSGREPVYYTNDSYTTILRISTNDSGTGTAADGAKMKPGANGYRLPTEAEWEYAGRGGVQSGGSPWTDIYAGQAADSGHVTETSQTLTAGDPGPYQAAWFYYNACNINGINNNTANAHYGAHPVGTKAPSSKDLYDMSGNVFELCWDWDSIIDLATITNPAGPDTGSYRVFRGGSWGFDASVCALSARNIGTPGGRSSGVGFRVACP